MKEKIIYKKVKVKVKNKKTGEISYKIKNKAFFEDGKVVPKDYLEKYSNLDKRNSYGDFLYRIKSVDFYNKLDFKNKKIIYFSAIIILIILLYSVFINIKKSEEVSGKDLSMTEIRSEEERLEIERIAVEKEISGLYENKNEIESNKGVYLDNKVKNELNNKIKKYESKREVLKERLREIKEEKNNLGNVISKTEGVDNTFNYKKNVKYFKIQSFSRYKFFGLPSGYRREATFRTINFADYKGSEVIFNITDSIGNSCIGDYSFKDSKKELRFDDIMLLNMVGYGFDYKIYLLRDSGNIYAFNIDKKNNKTIKSIKDCSISLGDKNIIGLENFIQNFAIKKI